MVIVEFITRDITIGGTPAKLELFSVAVIYSLGLAKWITFI
jgi:hypothetical protein